MFTHSNMPDNGRYKRLFENMPEGYAYFEMVYDNENKPIDCIFLEVNRDYYDVAGFTSEQVLGKRLSELVPALAKSEFDWLGTFNKVAYTGKSTSFAQFVPTFGKWISFSVISDRCGYFAVIFYEITTEKNKSENLKLLHHALMEYIKFPPSYIDYSMITDDLLKLSGAKYTFINIYDKEKKQVIVKAVSGDRSGIKKISEIIGFDLVGSKWVMRDAVVSSIKSQGNVIKVENSGFLKDKIPPRLWEYAQESLFIGDIFSLGLFYGEEVLGSVYIVMPLGKNLLNPELIELFSQQLSIVLLKFKAEQDLQQIKERFEFALEGSGEGVWDWNIQTNGAIYSDRYKEITGADRSEVWDSYDDWETRVHPKDLDSALDALNMYMGGEIPYYSSEYRLKCKDGSYKWVLSRGKVISRTDDGVLLRMVGTIEDISRNKQLEEELIKAIEIAEEASKDKSEYLANMSHELRTPLNVMLSAIQLFELYLKSDPASIEEKAKKHLKAMRQNCFRLLRLVNNLIDTTRIDAGFFDIHLQNHNIVSIVEGITLSVLEYIKQKNIELVYDTDVEEKIIACDTDMIERIILNLLSNAIKFTNPNGFIHVTVYDRTDHIAITVKDNGVGIPTDKQELIFQRYKQVNRLLTREHEGSGIGLSLTKSIVEMHGGRLIVKSEYGIGSEFTVELPAKVLPANQTNKDDLEYLANNKRLIERMNIEFADVYK